MPLLTRDTDSTVPLKASSYSCQGSSRPTVSPSRTQAASASSSSTLTRRPSMGAMTRAGEALTSACPSAAYMAVTMPSASLVKAGVWPGAMPLPGRYSNSSCPRSTVSPSSTYRAVRQPPAAYSLAAEETTVPMPTRSEDLKPSLSYR